MTHSLMMICFSHRRQGRHEHDRERRLLRLLVPRVSGRVDCLTIRVHHQLPCRRDRLQPRRAIHCSRIRSHRHRLQLGTIHCLRLKLECLIHLAPLQ